MLFTMSMIKESPFPPPNLPTDLDLIVIILFKKICYEQLKHYFPPPHLMGWIQKESIIIHSLRSHNRQAYSYILWEKQKRIRYNW